MALKQFQVDKANSQGKLTKLSDGGGLQLWVFPDDAKRWRLAYRFDGKQKLLALGVYPAMSLKEAREARDAARKLLDAGVDPGQQKKLDKLVSAHTRTNTFEAVAAELVEKKRREGKSESTLSKLQWLLSFALPTLGPRPISEIKAAEVLVVLKQIEARGKNDSAKRLRATIGQVFRLAVASSRAETDPTEALRGALTTPKAKHRAAITQAAPLGNLLRAVDNYEGAPETIYALQLLALTFVRPGELRQAEWSEFDLEAGVWKIPGPRMKMKRPHKAPLAPQAVALLKELQAITGRGKYLFPSIRSTARRMSENTLNAALRRLGYTKDEMTAHGFRAAASSLLNESGEWNPDAIEAQLAHVEANAVRKAYARSEYWDERVRMMNWWADKLDGLRHGGEVIRLKTA
ncbi:tyrosine-type recombinase/integrase [Roseiarcus sp.]|uniref:tyrosine-type recombinase/integrase n=1 Tax=Roseiarcus sp. TaxID=1969460 RepID=UPI003F9D37ED